MNNFPNLTITVNDTGCFTASHKNGKSIAFTIDGVTTLNQLYPETHKNWVIADRLKRFNDTGTMGRY